MKNLVELEKKLIAAAQSNPPGDHVPYAFEKRIMARLKTPLEDAWMQWGKALWRGAAACVAITLLWSAWSFLPAEDSGSTTNLTQVFDSTVFAMAEQMSDTW